MLRRLDGLPLGIELAARQVAVMPLRAVRERLDRALDLSTGRQGPEDERQRTLRATIDSSYRLLTADEQWLLRAIAPFVGGVDLATVEVLAEPLEGDPLDLLHRLVDSSLLVADAESARYRLLFTVRAFLVDEITGWARPRRHTRGSSSGAGSSRRTSASGCSGPTRPPPTGGCGRSWTTCGPPATWHLPMPGWRSRWR